MRHRWALGWMGLAAAAALVFPWAGTDAVSLSQLQREQHQTQTELNAARQQYQQTQSAIYTTFQQIQGLNQSLSADRARVAFLGAAISRTEARLSATRRALVRIRAHLRFEASLLTGQVRLMEERGAVGYLDVVLGARSFSDFISRLYLLGQLANMAGRLVTAVRADEAREAWQQHRLTRQEATLLALQSQAEVAAQTVSANLTRQQQLAISLHQQEAQQQSLLAALNQKLATITAEIQALLDKYQGGYLTLHGLYNAMYPLVEPIAAQFSLPPPLIIAVITEESGGNARAVSTANAIGLMQVEPGTAAAMGFPVSDLYNPQQNVLIGCTYLADMLDLFGKSPSAAANVTPALATPPGNDWSYLSMALAAYNAGPGAVEAYGLKGLYAKPWGVQGYVTNIENLYLEYSSWGAP
jgi:soluble lytic murein transglycosylase-like protein